MRITCSVQANSSRLLTTQLVTGDVNVIMQKVRK
jgi:hypothetical protein